MYKVLIVEDNLEISRLIETHLTVNNFAVLKAYNGQQGLDLIDSTVDLVLLDIMMPIMDGLTFVKLLRERTIKTPVIFMSAKGTEEDKVKGLVSGGDDYIVKPINFKELVARINSQIRRHLMYNQSFTDSIIQYKHFSLNTSNYQLLIDNETCELTKTEFSLFHKLLVNHGKVVSYKELSLSIEDSEYIENQQGTIIAHIKNIRRKLERFGYKESIKNVRGVGYKIE